MAKLFEVQEGDYIQLPWAQLVFYKNEWHLDGGNVNDPTGISFRGGNGCKVSWKSANGEERVLLQLRQNPNQDGEYYLGALDQSRYADLQAKGDPNALDHAMIEVMTINSDGVEFRVPIKASAGIVGMSAPTILPEGFPNKIVSPDGRLELDIQNADAPGCVMYFDGVAIGRLLTIDEINKLSRYMK